jgi:hypothetical protein
MAGTIALRTNYTAEALRRLAARARDANVARRLLSLAAVREGTSRGEAARIGRPCGTGYTVTWRVRKTHIFGRSATKKQ